MNKIGIITFHFAHNYGAVLQAYALKTYFNNLGVKADIINYCPLGMADSYSINPIKILLRREYGRLKSVIPQIKQSRLFNRYIEEYLVSGKKYQHINEIPTEEYSLLLLGGDQVWNGDLVDDLSEYLLSGIHGVRKGSYAASTGKRDIVEKYRRMFEMFLSEFKIISVREEESLKMFNEIGIKAYHVADPVFLLKKEMWIDAENKEYKTKNGYILYVDMMHDDCLKNKAIELSKKKKLPIVSIHPTCWFIQDSKFIKLKNVGPREYLKLVEKANYIVTNSFHCLAFSMIFKKKGIYYLKNEYNMRTEDLIHGMGITIENDQFDFSLFDYEAKLAKDIDTKCVLNTIIQMSERE